ncbi:WD40 repeat domain-containing protein [Botryobacter ruber]|uniref:WD40 repeat domain-containing protein n=1 Tax=Botryobacter ruber TaxID=2171629 RepID=UPI000E0A54E0|nr:WD40 repeat domain-containing protein [Botryobacter ruber]
MRQLLSFILVFLSITSFAQELRLNKLEPGAKVVHQLVYSPDGKYLAFTDRRSVQVVQTGAAQERFVLTNSSGKVRALAFSNDGNQLLAAQGSSAKLWNLADKQVVHTFGPQKGTVLAVAFSPDNEYVALGGTGKTVSVWHVATKSLVTSFTGHQKGITDLDFSLDGKFLLSASGDKTIKVWDMQEKVLYKTLLGHNDWVKSLAVSPDGKHVVSAGYDKEIMVWSIADKKATERVQKLINPHTSWISALSFNSSNKLVSIGHDNLLVLYDLQNMFSRSHHQFFEEKMPISYNAQPSAVALDPINFQVAVATLGSGLYLDNYLQLKVKPSHSFSIQTINGEQVGKGTIAAEETANVIASTSRPEEIKVLLVTNNKTKEAMEFRDLSGSEIKFAVSLPDLQNDFTVVIEDKDKNIKPVEYSFQIRRGL